MKLTLFEEAQKGREELAEGAAILRGFALADAPKLWACVQDITGAAPFRRMITPGGLPMSAGMTNCGKLGWVSDRSGYRYDALDPLSQRPWPGMPPLFFRLAQEAAAEVGFKNFQTDACLINDYLPGAKLTLHQDKNEEDFSQPIVSVSLGLPAVFQFGGLKRSDPCGKWRLQHGDVVVWGGPSRLRFHGVLPIKPGHHDLLGERRINLTFRRAG